MDRQGMHRRSSGLLLRKRNKLAQSVQIQETQEMLEFCAKHNISPKIEVISADQIDEAYERVLASDVKYRFVIDISTM